MHTRVKIRQKVATGNTDPAAGSASKNKDATLSSGDNPVVSPVAQLLCDRLSRVGDRARIEGHI